MKLKRPGRVTVQDVAEAAGVSRSAVSRTFTDGASVSGRTRAKVEAAAERLGYFPNALARSLTTRRTRLIGLVSNNFENPAFMEVFDLFTRRLQDRGLRPLLLNLTENSDPAASARMLLQYSVDGVILASSTLSPEFVGSFVDAGLPVVHAFGRYTKGGDTSVITVDNAHGGELAARRFVDGGYRAIGILGGPRDATSTEDRLKGFSKAMKKAGLTIRARRFAEEYTHDAGSSALRALLAETQLDGIFCGDDILAMGARDACRELGLEVPEDIGLIGFNDLTMAAWRSYDLTTIRQPIREITLTAVDQVVSLVNEPDRAPESRLFPCSLVERGSLRPLQSAL